MHSQLLIVTALLRNSQQRKDAGRGNEAVAELSHTIDLSWLARAVRPSRILT
jgi:hypothetical protein